MAKSSKSRSYDEDDMNEEDLQENDFIDEEEDESYGEDHEDDRDFRDDDSDYGDDGSDSFEEEVRKPKRAPAKKKAATKKRTASDAQANKEVRLKAFWAVYSQNFQLVEQYEYGDKEAAEKKAAELTETKKMLYFVKLVKKVIES